MAKQHSLKAIEEALVKAGGIQAVAAALLGCNRSTICKRIKKSARLQEVVEEIEETTLDLAEGKLKKAIKKDAPWAIKLYLETKGKKRGYTRTVQLEAHKPIPITFSPAQAALG